MDDNIKCHQCGSRDLTKVQVSKPAGLSADALPESVQYKCLICGKHFSHTENKEE